MAFSSQSSSSPDRLGSPSLRLVDPDDPHEYNATDPTEDDCEVYFRDREYWGVMESCRGLDGEPAWKVTDVGVHIFAD